MADLMIQFSLLELCAFLGLIQSTYILVYIFLRSNNFKRAVYPALFFLTIGCAFFVTIIQRYWNIAEEPYSQINLLLWTLCAPISTLLVIQIARITKPPPLIYWPVLLLIPMIFGALYAAGTQYDFIDLNWFHLANILIGSLCLLMVWFKRDLVDRLHKRKNGKERFWLIMAFIILNVGLIATNFIYFGTAEDDNSYELIRVIIGISFLYITSTSLFRIYPPAISLNVDKSKDIVNLSDTDIDIALEIENLLHLQKVYQEPSYGRSDMAKELHINESQLSRIVNGYFQKNVPLLLNNLRVEEAKTLLVQTEEGISLISEESGFNSIATFNRVFKDIAGVSPKEYRSKHQ